jgi:flagellar motility protein MotE (MotC chaperone)
MMRKGTVRIRVLLIGLVAAKIGVTLLYLAGTVSISEFVFHQQSAIAQEKEPQKETHNGESSHAAKTKDHTIDVRALLRRLDSERRRLDKEEERIKRQRAQLEDLKEEIEGKIEKLSTIQQRITADLEKKEALLSKIEQRRDLAEETKMKRLGKVYASMKSKQAAAIVDNMDIEVVQKIFSHMKGEQIGNILSYVNRERAAKISERLAENNIEIEEPPQNREPESPQKITQ